MNLIKSSNEPITVVTLNYCSSIFSSRHLLVKWFCFDIDHDLVQVHEKLFKKLSSEKYEGIAHVGDMNVTGYEN